MYALVIDGREVRRWEFVKPLIESLDYYARGTAFNVACISKVVPGIAPACGHRTYSEDSTRCAEMSCPNYVRKADIVIQEEEDDDLQGSGLREESLPQILLGAYREAKRLADGGSVTAAQDLKQIISDMNRLGIAIPKEEE